MNASQLIWDLKMAKEAEETSKKKLVESRGEISRINCQIAELLLSLPVGAVIECYGVGVQLTPSGLVNDFPVFDGHSVKTAVPVESVADEHHAGLCDIVTGYEATA